MRGAISGLFFFGTKSYLLSWIRKRCIISPSLYWTDRQIERRTIGDGVRSHNGR